MRGDVGSSICLKSAYSYRHENPDLLGLENLSLDAVGDEILAKVVDALRELRRPLVAGLGVAVAGPEQLCQGGRSWPDLLADDRIVDLFGPQRCFATDNVGGLLICKIEGELEN